ncbi:tryptophan transporter [Natronincola ferrireducens]|uniref:Tryptophan transporter TrpP n=1 Tax=Natronincola ferrireducens TaxID=393762 RepID=A0A1G8YBV8_9FIRM|nr:tryptophan transporter [Natronincola ferrireducens]SDJ99884.1 Tryptophan transporter TrpP [Natronincola ferrireducens]
MNLRKSILTALLLAIGLILHQITPGTLGGIKFDLFLPFVFIALFLNTTFKNALLTGLLGGILTAMTTSFPGGQLPNLIDKVGTCIILFVIIKGMESFKDSRFFVGVIACLGTVISGSIFLGSALLMIGLPAPFMVLFMTIVLPTSLTNIFVTMIIYRITQNTLRVTGMKLV